MQQEAWADDTGNTTHRIASTLPPRWSRASDTRANYSTLTVKLSPGQGEGGEGERLGKKGQ